MNLKYNLDEHSVREINATLEKGVANRASDIVFVMAFVFSIYGIMSTDIIAKFNSSVTLWSNTWPRLLFNGLPFLILGLFLKKGKASASVKTFAWAFFQPLIFVIACCIHVWPSMLEGHLELYKYFHAANMFVITFGITFIAPSRAVLLTHLGSYTILFLVPLLYITRQDSGLSSMIINDYICMTLGASVAGHLTYKLRRKVAFMDAQIKSNLTPLVGNTIASAIYNNSLERLNNKKAFGLILSMDLRGYTQFMHTTPKEVTSSFMREYHFLVSTTVGKFSGFIHKTAGDSHLISFGLMDETPDLSDIAAIKSEVAEAETNKARILSEKAIQMFEELMDKYEKLKSRFDVTDRLKIGAALAAGPITLQIQGNEKYRQEVDIDGDTIVRSARLESYTKLLISTIEPTCSMLIISPEIIENLNCKIESHVWIIREKEFSVRDYPELKQLYYKTWLSTQVGNKKIAV